MKIKLRKQTSDGLIKFENKTQIKDVFVNAEAVDSKKEAIAIVFKGVNDSGFIELSRNEINFFLNKLNTKRHLMQ